MRRKGRNAVVGLTRPVAFAARRAYTFRMPQRPRNTARLWRPNEEDGLALFKADFTTFRYERHAHEEFALGVIEHGAQRFRHKGAAHRAPAASMITVNPDEIHDGRADTGDGYRYRMVYVSPDRLENAFRELFPQKGGLPAFPSPVTHDAALARRFRRALAAAEQRPNILDELLLPVLYDLFSRHAAPKLPGLRSRDIPRAVRAVERHLRERLTDNPTLDELAAQAGLSKFHFLRVFKAATGFPPHAYLVRRRLALAKTLLERGAPIAEAALQAGFADQSHLTRRFKAAYGVTPGAFQRPLG